MEMMTHKECPTTTRTSMWLLLALLIAILISPISSTFAQDPNNGSEAPEEQTQLSEAEEADESLAVTDTIVVTGSRLRRDVSDTPDPVVTIDRQSLDERGYISVADALNEITSLDPQLNLSNGGGGASGSGQQFPSLFGLGAGRTLTLINGRRGTTTTSGLGDARVDANTIPRGLIDRIEIVQAGGAAVYGSDAIGGVVNYILRDDYEGAQLDVQTGDSTRGDFENRTIRLTLGQNFGNGRGNIAANVEWSESPSLEFDDRPLGRKSITTSTPNRSDTGPNDGIPSRLLVENSHFWPFNRNGVIWQIPNPTRPDFMLAQFGENGIIPYNSGNILGIPFADGGDGRRLSELTGMRTAVERQNASVIGHYDITDNIRLSTELTYAKNEGEFRPQGFGRTVLGGSGPSGSIVFFRTNPFLSASTVNSLAALYPPFGGGAPLFLSKDFYDDLLPTPNFTSTTDLYRGNLTLEGSFEGADRLWDWSVSTSAGRVETKERGFAANNGNFARALAAVNANGSIVCAVNADANPSNDDPACVPFNPFGFNASSQAARDYVVTEVGQDVLNKQRNYLGTLGTSLFSLPAGDVKALAAYEYRSEKADFNPLLANQLGLVGTGTRTPAQAGEYHTSEASLEVLVPIFGGDYQLPFVRALDFSGAFRAVDNSLVGNEQVWSTGLRWQLSDAVMLRATRSRNFRAPTLAQLLQPTAVAQTQSGADPCDIRNINAGPSPATRRANCEAEWAANPQYGDLGQWINQAQNFSLTAITSGGNPNLDLELSDTWTFGLIFRPAFIPGLTLAVDRIQIDIDNGLSAFTNTQFMQACYDNPERPAAFCNEFSRLPQVDGTTAAGTVVSGRTTTVNAGAIEFRGETYYLGYDVSESLFPADLGSLNLSIEATRVEKLLTSVTGTVFAKIDGTATQPDLTAKLRLRYSNGPLALSYQAYHLSDAIRAPGANIENDPAPFLASNTTHAISGQYDFGSFLVRAGIDNLSDKGPSYPAYGYGDILGRRYFLGVSVNF